MKKYLFFFLSIFLFSVHADAQLKKGDWSIGFTSGVSVSTTFINDFDFVSGGLSPRAGYMVTDNIMTGLGLSFSGSNSFSSNSNIIGSGFYSFSPFVRYYLPIKPRLMSFGFLNAQLLNSNYDSDNLSGLGGTAYMGTAGLGADLFIAPNVALEITAGARIFEGGDFSIDALNTRKVFLNLGFRTFLHDRFTETFDLKDRYLKKGNFILSGSGSFTPYDGISFGTGINFGTLETEDRTGYRLSLYPGLSYFQSDNWLVGGGANISYVRSNDDYSLGTGLNIKSKYFIPVADRLFVVPSGNIGFSRNATQATFYSYKEVDGTEISCNIPSVGTVFLIDSTYTTKYTNIVSGDASLELNYFTQGNSIVKGGVSYFHTTSVFDGDVSTYSNSFSAFMGAEYFFASNLSISATFIYDFRRVRTSCVPNGDSTSENQTARLNIGIAYFIFKKFDKTEIN